MPAPTLNDGTVTLRAPRADDAQGVWEQCQDAASQRWTMVPVPYTHADAREFVTTQLPGWFEEGSDLGFVVEAEGRFAGSVSLRPQSRGQAEIGYGAHPWVRGTGHVEAALRLLIGWGFDDLDLDVVLWRAHLGNWASRKVAHRLGFRVEGAVRRLVPQRGELRDAWIGSLLRDDPREPPHPWLEPPELIGDGVRLRPLRADDAVRVVEACRDDATQHWLSGLPRDYDLDDAHRYLGLAQERQAAGTGVAHAVTGPDDDLLLGAVGLWDLEAGRDCELGYWTHPEARGRGVTTAAARLAVRWALDPSGLGVERVHATVAKGNTGSQRVLERAGLRLTGRQRGASRLGDGRRADRLTYDVLAGEA